MIRGVHLGQVVDVHPKEYEVSVYLPDLEGVLGNTGVRVRLSGRMQRPVAGEFYLPQIGEMGVVAFPLEDPRSGVWLASIPHRGHHLVPEELLQDDPDATLVHHPGGQYTIQEGDGGTEAVWPDGTSLQVIRKKDGGFTNRSWLGRLWERFRTRRPGKAWVPPSRQRLQPQPPPVDLYLHHSSGTVVHITADGSVEVRTAKGHGVRLFDSTEKARDPQTGSVIAEETPERERSHLVIETEVGHRITMWDDPNLKSPLRYVQLETAAGHVVRLEDWPNRYVEVRSASGHRVHMHDMSRVGVRSQVPDRWVEIEWQTTIGKVHRMRFDSSGASIVIDGDLNLSAQGNMTLTASGNVVIDGATISIG